MTIQELLANQDTKLIYSEPWPAIDDDGIETTVNMNIIMTVRDAIKVQRMALKQMGNNRPHTEENLLLSFLDINWASPLNKEKL